MEFMEFVEKSHNLKRRGRKTFVSLRSLEPRSSNRLVRSFTCIFFPSDNFVLNIFKLGRITCTLLLSNKKYFAIGLSLREISFVV